MLFRSNIAGNAGAIETGNELLKTGIDVAGQAVSGAGKGISSLGSIAATSTNPKVKALGAAASIAGEGLSAFADSAAKVAKFAVDFLGKQLAQLRDGFKSLNASGAMFADGMTGMQRASATAGLTIQQFGKVVQENAKSLGSSGMGMSAAAERMASIKGDIDKSGVGMRLQKLGYSFEEQAGLVSEVMGNLNRFGKGRMVSDQTIMQQTEAYAQNLRLLSSVSGEEAKAKMQQAREAANNLAFQNKLAEMAPEQAEQIQQAMSKMSAQERKDFMEMQVFGTVINKSGAIMMSANKGYANQISEYNDAANQGTLDLKRTLAIQADNKQAILRDRRATKEIGMAAMAGAGNLEGTASSMNDIFNETAKNLDPDALKKQMATMAKAAETQDKLTKQFLETEKAYQESMVKLQSIAINNMQTYVDKLAWVIKNINDQLGDEGYISKIMNNPFTSALIQVVAMTVLPRILQKIPGVGKLFGPASPPAPGTPGAPGNTPPAPAGGGGSAAGRPAGGLRQNSAGQWINEKGRYASKEAITAHLAEMEAEAAKNAAGAGAGKAAEGAAGKGAGKAAGKAAGKSLLKKIPFLGLGAAGLFAVQRAMSGDWGGAGLELASGAAGTIPGFGTAASVGIDAALAAKDAGMWGGTTGTPNLPEPTTDIAKLTPDSSAIGMAASAGDTSKYKEMIATMEKTTDVLKPMNSLQEQMLAQLKDNNSLMKQMIANTA